MNDELSKYYELLGVAPGTSGRELKQAYHGMAKVWHPDRFSHDPRLQRKAQEKLKEINDAYEQLTSGTAARRTRPASAPGAAYTPPAATVRHVRAPAPGGSGVRRRARRGTRGTAAAAAPAADGDRHHRRGQRVARDA